MHPNIPTRARAAATFDGWTLYELPPAGHIPSYSPLWVNFKLLAPTDTPRRWGRTRAFWLGWNVLELRLVKNAARFRLRDREPALEAAVLLFLQRTYDRSWLLEVGGLTAAEVEAERLRLAAPRGARAAL